MSNAIEIEAAELHVGGDVVTFSADYQGVTLWLGDQFPFHIGDEMTTVDIADGVQSPVQRAVVAARLRTIADALSA